MTGRRLPRASRFDAAAIADVEANYQRWKTRGKMDSASESDAVPGAEATWYGVWMTDGSEFAWDGVTTMQIGAATFLVAPQGTLLSVSQVRTMEPRDD